MRTDGAATVRFCDDAWMAQPLGPTPLAERSLAPDLARGAMLALIVLANVRAFFDVPLQGLRGYPDPRGTSLLDDVVATVQLVLVDGRAYPLFGLLFGYGVWQLAARRLDGGAPPGVVVGLLQRRSVVLLAIGALHGILLFPGEIIAAYGLYLLVLPAVMTRASDAALAAWSATAALVMCLLLAGTGHFGSVGDPVPTGWTDAVGGHAGDWLAGGVLSNALGVSVTIPLGVLAARHGVLDRPGEHLDLLRRVALLGLGGALLGGAWYGLVGGGFLPPQPSVAPLMSLLHGVSGYAGGVGYAALFGLVAASVARRARSAGEGPGPVVRLIRAQGRMSMSGYLWQTLVLVVVVVPWGPLGLGAGLSTSVAAAVALGTWVLGLAVAGALASTGRRGPFESLVRWWTYRGSSESRV